VLNALEYRVAPIFADFGIHWFPRRRLLRLRRTIALDRLGDYLNRITCPTADNRRAPCPLPGDRCLDGRQIIVVGRLRHHAVLAVNTAKTDAYKVCGDRPHRKILRLKLERLESAVAAIGMGFLRMLDRLMAIVI
jgi:hypothetical protein